MLVALHGEYDYVKGVGFMIAGGVIVTIDLLVRLRKTHERLPSRLFATEFGGLTGLQSWIVGSVVLLGGIVLLLSPSE